MSKQASEALVPHHVAIVMDGNGRWAKKRFMNRLVGHRQGLEALRLCISQCMKRGIGVLTVFAFSSENWSRPQEEVSGLMELMGNALTREVPRLHDAGVRIHLVGERKALSARLREGLEQAERLTRDNERLILNVCFNYGGRWDIVQAAARLHEQGLPFTEDNLSSAMAMSHVPDPDLIIRTGGEYRISNFLLWQSAYSELYFSDILWPDFDAAALDAAIEDYAQRERRFGKTSAQVSDQDDAC